MRSLPKLPSLPFQVGPRTRKVLRIVGYILFALLTFLFALQLTFPYDRVKDRVLLELGKKYDVSIGAVDRGIIPGRMTFKNIILKTRPSQKDVDKAETIEDEKERKKALALLVTSFYVESLEVDLGLLALISGKASLDIEATIGSGTISGNITIGKGGTSIDLEGEDLAGDRLPMREMVGLPISGDLEFSFVLDLPNRKNKANKVAASWKHAEGAISFACPANCVVGDGKTKLKMKVKKQSQEAFQGDGVKFGKVNIDSLVAKVEIGKGNLELTKFETKSADGELHVDYQMALEQTLDESAVNGCLRFAGSEVLRKREPDTHSAFLATGALRGPDNLFHIKLTGTFKNMKRLPQSCGPGAIAANDNAAKAPQLKITPTEAPGDAGAGTAPPPQINPPPPAAPFDAGAGSATGSGSATSGSGSGSGITQVPPGDHMDRGGPPPTEDPMSGSGSAAEPPVNQEGAPAPGG